MPEKTFCCSYGLSSKYFTQLKRRSACLNPLIGAALPMAWSRGQNQGDSAWYLFLIYSLISLENQDMHVQVYICWRNSRDFRAIHVCLLKWWRSWPYLSDTICHHVYPCRTTDHHCQTENTNSSSKKKVKTSFNPAGQFFCIWCFFQDYSLKGVVIIDMFM